MASHRSRPGTSPAVRKPGMLPHTVRFRARKLGGVGVECLSLAQLRQRGTSAHLAAIQRLEFLMFVLYTGGSGEHIVDLVRYPVGAGTLVVVQPGNLHQFQLNSSLQGQLLVVDAQFMLPERLATLKPLLSGRLWPVCSQMSDAAMEELLAICGHFDTDASRQGHRELLAALARQRLYTWLLLLRIHWNANQDDGLPDPLASGLALEFQALLERHFLKRWTVQDYARKLGYAERTVTRACQACSGTTAKAMIDARVLLEVKRLLAHGHDSIEAISQHLGFGDSSQLARFFRHHCGMTPHAFRISHKSQGVKA